MKCGRDSLNKLTDNVDGWMIHRIIWRALSMTTKLIMNKKKRKHRFEKWILQKIFATQREIEREILRRVNLMIEFFTEKESLYYGFYYIDI